MIKMNGMTKPVNKQGRPCGWRREIKNKIEREDMHMVTTVDANGFVIISRRENEVQSIHRDSVKMLSEDEPISSKATY